MIRRRLAALALSPLLFAASAGADEQLPAGFELIQVPGNYSSPVALEFADDGTLFVAQKNGKVRIVPSGGGAQQATPFVDITDEVNHSADRGLLGLALHPGFLADGGPTSWVYLLYTVSPIPGLEPGYNENDQYSFSRLTRYKAIVDQGNILADLASRDILLGNQEPDGKVPDAIASLYTSHSNGRLLFGTDGTLFVFAGDGAHWSGLDAGGQDDPGFDDWMHPQLGTYGPMPKEQDSGKFRSQDPRSLAGKVLRIDPETGGGLPSNPFWDGDALSNPSRVWALGLRNPYRAGLVPGTGVSDPAQGNPGTLIIGDVGPANWEEINVANGGENFGWPCYEANVNFGPANGFTQPQPNPYGFLDCSTSTFGPNTFPIVSMHHTDEAIFDPPGSFQTEGGLQLPGLTSKCVIGGVFYTSGNYPTRYIGRYFFADYVEGWISTIEFEPSTGQLIAIRPFAQEVEDIVCISRNPASGDLYIATRGDDQEVYQLRYAENLTPDAIAQATPTSGLSPLDVQFDSSASSDPEGGELTIEWDFGDGSPLSTEDDPEYTYTTDGVYTAILTVTDDGGLTAGDTVVISVGDTAPIATISSPEMGQIYTGTVVLPLIGSAVDAQTASPTLEWVTELYHDTHVHDYTFATGPTATLPIEPHGSDDDLVYYRVEFTATDEGGLVGEDHVFVFPSENVLDKAGAGALISRVDELIPPTPLGTGNEDIEVIRDGVKPGALGSPDEQFDSAHGGDQGTDDWVGIELPSAPSVEFRYFGLDFQEGLHNADGGWFEDFTVEVRDDFDVWHEVENLHVDPPYPFAQSGNPGFDGTPFESYELRFDPIWGEAIRLRGTPGGSTGYISVAELRALSVDIVELDPIEIDVSDQGSIVARVFELDPPQPEGVGNLDPETIRNGTTPPASSPSEHAQYDTEHGGDQGTLDWIGYSYGSTRTFTKLVFQEGLNQANGGWFDELRVEVQLTQGGPWTEVSNLSSTPAYPGTILGTHYETFELVFDPVVAYAIRIAGDPGGSSGFISVGELSAFAFAHDCNANGIEDADEIGQGLANDFNGNGVPDECDYFSGDVDSVSVGTGGVQNWTLDAPSQAGSTYLVVGSMSGATPGLVLPDISIPINPDWYTNITVLFPNAAPLVQSLGTLDGSGSASGSFSLTPGFPFLAGLTANHAFVTLDAFLSLQFASNAVPLQFTP